MFISKILADITETTKLSAIKFSVGYLQIDNQWDEEAAYAVILKPRDLYYEDERIIFQLEHESDKERAEREQQGLSTLTEETAKMFQSQIEINSKASKRQNGVLYIESMAFLL